MASATSLGLLDAIDLDDGEVKKLASKLGRLRAGYITKKQADGRICYVQEETGAVVYDRPVDLCGTHGCILQVNPSPLL